MSISTSVVTSIPRLPLDALLSDRLCYTALYSFARTEHSEETVAFIDAVENLRRQCAGNDEAATNSTLIATAGKIFDKFAPDAEYAIVWDPIIIKRLQLQLHNTSQLASPFELFPQQEREMNLLTGGILHRFYQSKEYRSLLDGLINRLSGDWAQLHLPDADVHLIGGCNEDKATSIQSSAMTTRSRFEQRKTTTASTSSVSSKIHTDSHNAISISGPKVDSDGAMYMALSPSSNPNKCASLPLSPASTRREYVSVAADSAMAALFETFNSNPIGVEILRSFMKSEFSVDNYDFLLSVMRLQSRFQSPEEIRNSLSHIYATFLEKNSKHEVTFPSAMRRDVDKIFSSNSSSASTSNELTLADVHVFDAIAYVVLSTIKTDIMRRFIRSSVYDELIKDLTERNRERNEIKLSSPNAAHSTIAQTPIHSPKSENSAKSVSFDVLLCDGELLQSFHHFCQREHSDENIRMYVAVRNYRRAHRAFGDRALVEQGDIYNMAHKVFTDYIESTAPFQVTLSSDIRNAIQINLFSGRGDLFDDAVNVAIDRMRSDSFPRFLRSNDYVSIMKYKQSAHSKWGLASVSNAIMRKVSKIA